jgi:hypothetical protein
MPLQNRVDPYGALHAVAARGAWIGNRGVLHDERRRIVKPWRLERWIVCRLEFKGRHRVVFTPGRWTELFFLDEATAFAAGHRPCAECRRDAYEAFRAAWAGPGTASPPSAPQIDAILHHERLAPDGGKRSYEAELDALPDGTMVEHAGAPHLLWRGRLRPWRFDGYGAARSVVRGRVMVLTPASTVRALRRGYRLEVAVAEA